MTDRIKKLSIYKLDVPIAEGVYRMSGGRDIETLDATIVAIETASGIIGWGESSPLGAAYLPAFPEGARSAIAKLAPAVIGQDPTQLSRINQTMENCLKGHLYAKSAIDNACWDILGKIAGLPVCALLGGHFGGPMRAYWAVSKDTPEKMVETVRRLRGLGLSHFQLKVGGSVAEDIARIHAIAKEAQEGETINVDPNGGWTSLEALRVLQEIKGLNVIVEQPCETYAECLSVRSHTDLPFTLDESIDSVAMLLKAFHDRALDGVNIKLSRLGGLTRAKLFRDLCVTLGLSMTIEDTAGTDIAAAAVVHLAQSTPENVRIAAGLSTMKLAFRTAKHATLAERGYVSAPSRPGLGIEPILDVLGRPIFVAE